MYVCCGGVIGWVLHSALLVPYHSWRISHGKHHNNTGSCEHDEVFAPPLKEDLASEILLHSPLFNLFQIVVMLTIGTTPDIHTCIYSTHTVRIGPLAVSVCPRRIGSPLCIVCVCVFVLGMSGWMPGYLVLNATGPRKYRGQVNDHFNPWSALFSAKDRLDIIWSDIGFFAALTGEIVRQA